MPDTTLIGKSYAPGLYAVGREKIREYALAVGETNPLHLDVEAARAAGYADVVAPPMFAVVYCAPAMRRRDLRPRASASTSRCMVHGGQEFALGPARRRRRRDHDDRVASSRSRSAAGKRLLRLRVRLDQPGGETVCVGTWTNIVREVAT